MDVMLIRRVTVKNRRPTCRRLTFDDDNDDPQRRDLDENMRVLRALRQKLTADASDRYNFDFETCRPREGGIRGGGGGGRYEWLRREEKFADDDDRPLLQTPPSVERSPTSSDCLTAAAVSLSSSPSSSTSDTSKMNSRKRRQSTIPDYFPCKKHIHQHSCQSTDPGAK